MPCDCALGSTAKITRPNAQATKAPRRRRLNHSLERKADTERELQGLLIEDAIGVRLDWSKREFLASQLRTENFCGPSRAAEHVSPADADVTPQLEVGKIGWYRELRPELIVRRLGSASEEHPLRVVIDVATLNEGSALRAKCPLGKSRKPDTVELADIAIPAPLLCVAPGPRRGRQASCVRHLGSENVAKVSAWSERHRSDPK